MKKLPVTAGQSVRLSGPWVTASEGFAGTWWPTRKTGLMEVFGFDSVYETQNQTSLSHNGIIKWGFSRRQELNDTRERSAWGQRGGLVVDNLILGEKQVLFYTLHGTHLPVCQRRPVWTLAGAFQRRIGGSFWMDEWCPANVNHSTLTTFILLNNMLWIWHI